MKQPKRDGERTVYHGRVRRRRRFCPPHSSRFTLIKILFLLLWASKGILRSVLGRRAPLRHFSLSSVDHNLTKIINILIYGTKTIFKGYKGNKNCYFDVTSNLEAHENVNFSLIGY